MTQRRALKRILDQLEKPGLLDELTQNIALSDLNTLLLELIRNKTNELSAEQLLNNFARNRFVKPSDLNPIALKQMEIDMLNIAQSSSYQAVQLSPVAPLGSCSVVGTVDQNKVLSALRSTEVVADATNALALHTCDLLKNGAIMNVEDSIRFSTTHRHVRAQKFSHPGSLTHFTLFCMTASGKDTGSYSFEKKTLFEHLHVFQNIFKSLFQTNMTVKFIRHSGYTDAEGLIQRLSEHIMTSLPEITLAEHIEEGNNHYYRGLQFTLIVTINGQNLTIGDGGFVDWSQKLLGNQKERMMVSAIGIDRLLSTIS